MGRNAIPDRTPVTIKFPNELLAKIDAMAKETGLTRIAAVVAIAADWFDGKESAPAEPPGPRPSFSPARSKTVTATPNRTIPATVKGVAIKPARDLVTVKAEPAPAFKSRLKGEWAPAKGKAR